MSETMIGWIASLNIGMLSIACGLYQWGGRAGGIGKGIRRFGASFVIFSAINGTALILHKWTPWLLLLYPLCILTFVQGYGGHSLPKVLQRFLIAVTSVLCGVLCVVALHGGIWLLVPHIVVALSSVMFALKNPIHAAAEEVLVCLLLFGVALFYPFVV